MVSGWGNVTLSDENYTYKTPNVCQFTPNTRGHILGQVILRVHWRNSWFITTHTNTKSNNGGIVVCSGVKWWTKQERNKQLVFIWTSSSTQFVQFLLLIPSACCRLIMWLHYTKSKLAEEMCFSQGLVNYLIFAGIEASLLLNQPLWINSRRHPLEWIQNGFQGKELKQQRVTGGDAVVHT